MSIEYNLQYNIKKTAKGLAYTRLQPDKGAKKPVLVLIRGLARSMCHWMGFEKELAAEFDILIIDNRGFGYSSEVSVKWTSTIEDFAQDVLDVLDQEQIESAIFFGISLGGMISLQMALSFENRVKGVVVANSSVGGQLKALRLTPFGLISFLKCSIRTRYTEKILANVLIANDEEEKPSIIKAWKKIHAHVGVSKSNTIKQLLAAIRFSDIDLLKKIKAPVLVVSGDKDALVSAENSKIIHEAIPHSEFISIKGGGHEIFQNKSQELIVAMRVFKDKHL